MSDHDATTFDESITAHEAAPASILAPQYRATTVGLVSLVALVAFESMAVAAAMPTVARALDGLPLYALAFGITLATSVVGMVVGGQWSDRHGPATSLWPGLACFVIGLLVAGLANDMRMLLAGRLLQGLGAGAISVSLFVLAGRCYPQSLRPRLFAAFSAAWVVPSLLGPALSGWMADTIGWRWVFLAVPLAALPAAWMLRPALRGHADTAAQVPRRGRAAWACGAALGLCLLYLGGQTRGGAALAMLVPGAALAFACTWRLLPRGTLLAAHGLPSVVALRGLVCAAFFGTEAFLPLLLSRERGLSPVWAGVALSVGALGWSLGSQYQGHARNGWSRHRFLRVGTGAVFSGLVLTCAATWPSVPVWLAILGWTLAGLGMGLISASLSMLALSMSAPGEEGANGSALQLCEATVVAGSMAVGGSLFAALLATSAQAAYLANFAIALLMALLAMAIVGRTGARGLVVN
ncbi:MFS transporter [Lysobacter brunescens]|uniref:MFS transporter n=1 Tax=Lysobacter brunescens TaxID=262323 RepID=A0ABW2YA92_9GAMM